MDPGRSVASQFFPFKPGKAFSQNVRGEAASFLGVVEGGGGGGPGVCLTENFGDLQCICRAFETLIFFVSILNHKKFRDLQCVFRAF